MAYFSCLHKLVTEVSFENKFCLGFAAALLGMSSPMFQRNAGIHTHSSALSHPEDHNL
jgi:hypothetical protein